MFDTSKPYYQDQAASSSNRDTKSSTAPASGSQYGHLFQKAPIYSAMERKLCALLSKHDSTANPYDFALKDGLDSDDDHKWVHNHDHSNPSSLDSSPVLRPRTFLSGSASPPKATNRLNTDSQDNDTLAPLPGAATMNRSSTTPPPMPFVSKTNRSHSTSELVNAKPSFAAQIANNSTTNGSWTRDEYATKPLLVSVRRSSEGRYDPSKDARLLAI